jgi:thymidylate synthase
MYFQGEEGYVKLLKETLGNGESKTTRNGVVVSLFGCMINFKDIATSFPLITSKKMFFRGIVEELLWFLRGSTNANELKQKKVHIWDGNSTREYLDSIGLDYPEGELGPIYGWQWRKFGKEYAADADAGTYEDSEDSDADTYTDTDIDTDTDTDTYTDLYEEAIAVKAEDAKGIDQIKYVLEELSKDTNSRRAVLSAWNPSDLKKMALPPCHILYIFNRCSKGLSCHLTLRSSDLFLGLPFNIASTALLTHIFAHVLHIPANEISLSICDAHIYEEHTPQVAKQIDSEMYDLPKVLIKKEAPDIASSIDEKIKWIEELEFDDFELSNYTSGVSLPAVMK